MSESRHNPDQLLKEIQADEEKRNKGHLKIFFGYAAGVGKTYAMLEAAHMEKDFQKSFITVFFIRLNFL